MSSQEIVAHSDLTRETGVILDLPRERANWQWMSFFADRLAPGNSPQFHSPTEETALVLLGGKCVADWGDGARDIGQPASVFGGLPCSLYLPANHGATLRSQTACEIAECRVASEARLEPRLVTPADLTVSLRGGGNASRQIVDGMPPSFPGDRIIVVKPAPEHNVGSPKSTIQHSPTQYQEGATIPCDR